MSAVAAPTDVVARARAVLAGRLASPPLELSPERKAVFDRAIREHVEPTPEAYLSHYEAWAFQEHFDGTVVLYTRLPGGKIAVLGSGDDEYRQLFDGLTDEELNRVDLKYTNPHDGFWDFTPARGA